MHGTDITTGATNVEIKPPVLIDEASSTDFYIGTSRSFNNPGAANWRIKRIWQVGGVWMSGYANGDQGFTFIWDLRASAYTYS